MSDIETRYALRLKAYVLDDRGELDWIVFDIMNVSEDNQLERIKRKWTEGKIKADLSLIHSSSFNKELPIIKVPDEGYCIDYASDGSTVQRYTLVEELIVFVQNTIVEFYLLKGR